MGKSSEADIAPEGKRPACSFLELFLSRLPSLTVSSGLGLEDIALEVSQSFIVPLGDGCVSPVQRHETITICQ